jgi:hypothetical protein
LIWETSVNSYQHFLRDEEVFLHRNIVLSNGKLQYGGPSPISTAEWLKALYLMVQLGYVFPPYLEEIFEKIVNEHLDSLNYQDITLFLWADSVGNNQYSNYIWQNYLKKSEKWFNDSLSLSWALSAGCHYYPKAKDQKSVLKFLTKLYQKLSKLQSARSGLFRNSANRFGFLRHSENTGTIPSQAFSIQALTYYGSLFSLKEPLNRACICADTLISLQGSRGQWWWSYDTNKGSIINCYPIYSVTQDATMTMALWELQNAIGDKRFETSISKSFRWVLGNNEMDLTLVDKENGYLWRAIQQQADGTFTVLKEMYSYHPARCLYALGEYVLSNEQ